MTITLAYGASQRRAARCATACNTGATSVGELEMTCRISLIALCCSSAFASSRVRRSSLRSSVASASCNEAVIGRRPELPATPSRSLRRRFHLREHFFRLMEGGVRRRHPGVDRALQQNFLDLVFRDAVIEGGANVQLELVRPIERYHE